MELERHHAAAVDAAGVDLAVAGREARTGWELVQRDWSDRQDAAVSAGSLTGLAATFAGVRRWISGMLRCGAAPSAARR